MITKQQVKDSVTARKTALKIIGIEVEAWFQVLTQQAKESHLWVKLESRYMKSAFIYNPRTGAKIARIWVDFNGVVNYSLTSWSSFYEQTPTIDQAIEQIIDQTIGF